MICVHFSSGHIENFKCKDLDKLIETAVSRSLNPWVQIYSHTGKIVWVRLNSIDYITEIEQ